MTPPQQHRGTPLLEGRDLRTHIFTRRGVVKAVNGVSLQIRPGETLGLVGESGSGKSMTCLSILKLLPRGARIVSGQVLLHGRDLVPEPEDTMERVREKQIGLVLQNSLAALDPVFTIGTQVGEPLVVHEKLSWKAALQRVVALLRRVRLIAPESRVHHDTPRVSVPSALPVCQGGMSCRHAGVHQGGRAALGGVSSPP